MRDSLAADEASYVVLRQPQVQQACEPVQDRCSVPCSRPRRHAAAWRSRNSAGGAFSSFVGSLINEAQARCGDARRGILPPSEQRPNSLAQAWSRTCAFDPRMQLSVGRRRSAGEFIGEQDLPRLRTGLLNQFSCEPQDGAAGSEVSNLVAR